MQGDLLTAEEVAGRLRVQTNTVRLWARQGRIPSRKLSRKAVRFNLAEVVSALEASEKGRNAR